MQLLTFVVASSLMTGWCVGVFKPTRAQKKERRKKNTSCCVDLGVLLRYKPKSPVHQMAGQLAAVYTHLKLDANPKFASKGFVISIQCYN